MRVINNKRIRLISFNGQTKKLGEWADILGIHHASLIERLQSGWTLEEALTLPKGAHDRTQNKMVQCTKCGEMFPWNPEHFTTNSQRPCGCTQPCRNCRKIKSKEWYKAHKERATAGHRKSYHRNRKHNIDRAKAYRKTHLRKLDLIKHRLASHRRRLRERAQPGSITKHDIIILYKNQKGKCWWCSKPLKNKYEIDHRIPIARGGKDDRKNIVLSCVACNRSKRDKLPQEWAGRLL